MWMSRRLIDAVAIGRSLGTEHHLVEFADAERATLSASENFGFKQKATVNVYDNLIGATEIGVEQSKSFVA